MNAELAGYSTQILGRYGESCIEKNSDDPWMMYLSTSAPHLSYTPPFVYRDADVGQWSGSPNACMRPHPNAWCGDLVERVFKVKERGTLDITPRPYLG